jgi:hypothetical protein
MNASAISNGVLSALRHGYNGRNDFMSLCIYRLMLGLLTRCSLCTIECIALHNLLPLILIGA